MAKKEREEVELAFNLELETRKAQRGLALIEKALRKTASRSVEVKLDKKGLANFRKESKQYERDLKAMSKVISDVGGAGNLKAATKSLADLRKAQNSFDKKAKASHLAFHKAKKDLEEKLEKASTDQEKADASKNYRKKRRELQREMALEKRALVKHRRQTSKEMSGGASSLIFEKHTEMAEKQRKNAEAREKGISEMKTAEVGQELGESFADSVRSLAGKDLLGFAKGGAKMSATLLKGAGKYGMLLGRNMQIKGAGMGGMAGGAMAGVGKMMSSIAPLVQTLSKLGPILGMAASTFGAIFKAILDIEAAGKEMNKQILEGASAAETFAASGGKANRAFKNLSSTLDMIRADATSMQNLEWGLKSEDIIRVTNQMAQQGVTLQGLQANFKNAGKAASVSQRQIQGFGDMARMSFAYSRLMGVSLQEITDFQAEMFTELGQSLAGVNLSYARLTKDATESGIATNKFFSIIRGVSSDLGLYTTRLEQASVMLKLLGKAMNPREAQKFMSAATQGFKQMGEEDRLRMTLLAGEGKMRDIVADDLDRKAKLLYNDIAKGAGIAFDDVVRAAKAGKGELDKILSTIAPEQRGAIEGALSEMAMDRKELAEGGAMGTANAAQNLSAAGALEATKAALQRLGGNKKLKDMTGIEGYAARKAANVSMDQFRAMVKLEASVDKQREEMKEALKEPTKNPDMVARLSALGINLENIAKKSDADIIAAMEVSDQDALVAGVEQKDYAKQTAELTTTLTDKMGIVVDGIFNYLYVALKDLISVIHSVFDWLVSVFGGKKQVDPRVRQEKLRGVAGAVQSGWGETSKKADFEGIVSRDLATIFKASVDDDASTEERAKALADRMIRMKSALEQAGIEKNKRRNFLGVTSRGGSFEDAIQASGLTKEELRVFLDKAIYTVQTDKLDSLSNLESTAGQSLLGGGPSIEQARARAAEGMTGGGPSIEQAPTRAAEGMTGGGQQASSAVAASSPTTAAPASGTMLASPITGTTMPAPAESVLAEQVDMAGRENVQNLQNLYDALRRRGIMLDKTQLGNQVRDTIRLGTLDAFREALMEQSMYTSSDPTALLQRMKDSGFSGVGSLATKYEELKANAAGGHVVGVADGRAVIASRGEGLASVGKGEKIIPAGGGGGGGITVNVNGLGGADLANHLKKKIGEAIYEYKRREKFQ